MPQLSLRLLQNEPEDDWLSVSSVHLDQRARPRELSVGTRRDKRIDKEAESASQVRAGQLLGSAFIARR